MKAKKRSMAPEDGGDEASKRLKKEDDLARRPRRTATKVDYRKLNEGMASKREFREGLEEEQEEVEDLQEMSEEDFEGHDDDDDDDYVRKRRVQRSPSKKQDKRDDQRAEPTAEGTYGACMERSCAVCAREVGDGGGGGGADLFSDASRLSGKPLVSIFRAVVCRDVRPSFLGRRICSSCLSALEGVESTYLQFRRAADAFLDSFELGQRAVDADLVGVPNTELVGSPPSNVAAFASLGRVVLKLVDPTGVGFNALYVGVDFGVVVQRAYAASVVPAGELPPEEGDEGGGIGQVAKDGGSSGDKGEQRAGRTVTLVFEPETGTLEPATGLASAQLATPEDADPRSAQLYLTPEEFDAALPTRRFSQGILYLALEEVERACAKLLLGHKTKQQVLLGRATAAEYGKQVPGVDEPFTCSDCTASYPFLHMLSNHVHSMHGDEEPSAVSAAAAPGDEGGDGNEKGRILKVPVGRTGETPTLEKPFQCEHCDKCFSEYVTLSAHVDHYHGFSRACNVEGCGAVLRSIRDFAAHYVKHADVSFAMPDDFEGKRKAVYPCPKCNVSIQGLWKFVSHTYVHDREARFACPACGKRIIKVQNFKDHILRHQLSSDSQNLAPTTLLQMHKRPLEESASKSEDHVRKHQRLLPHACPDCGRRFGTPSNLAHHRAAHLPKEAWRFSCGECNAPFPSERRLKMHVANVHSGTGAGDCAVCGEGPFQNRHLLQVHMAEAHQDQGKQQEVDATDMSEGVESEGAIL